MLRATGTTMGTRRVSARCAYGISSGEKLHKCEQSGTPLRFLAPRSNELITLCARPKERSPALCPGPFIVKVLTSLSALSHVAVILGVATSVGWWVVAKLSVTSSSPSGTRTTARRSGAGSGHECAKKIIQVRPSPYLAGTTGTTSQLFGWQVAIATCANPWFRTCASRYVKSINEMRCPPPSPCAHARRSCRRVPSTTLGGAAPSSRRAHPGPAR